MKFALLSGAYKNAGDYLIVKRCKELLTYVYPDCSITEYERRKSLASYIDQVNEHDFLVIAGGPAYRKKMYPYLMPLMPNLKQIKIPIVTIGVGQRCLNNKASTIYKYKFDKGTKQLLDCINDAGFLFSCRDWQSVRMLHNNGYYNTIMTGCTAWYDIPNIDNLKCNIHSFDEVRKICISDPALIQNYKQVIALVDFLRKKNCELEIVMIFHRGTTADNNTSNRIATAQQKLKQTLLAKNVKCLDISYTADGFRNYDNCDIHIGYRVHAHLYNMSVRKASILIQEDSRGDGANEALGLPQLKAYKEFGGVIAKLLNKIGIANNYAGNKYLFSEIDDYLFRLEEQRYRPLECAYNKMNATFSVMLKQIQALEKGKKDISK